jgi:hypothetical protein
VKPSTVRKLSREPFVQVAGKSVASLPSALLGEEPPDTKEPLVDPMMKDTNKVNFQPMNYILETDGEVQWSRL